MLICVVSLFSIYLKCFFLIFFNFFVFVITCTISDFFLFSSCLCKFSLRLCFFNSFCSAISAFIAFEVSLIRCLSCLWACFCSNDKRIPLVFIIEENFFFSLFHTRPDFGFPLGISSLQNNWVKYEYQLVFQVVILYLFSFSLFLCSHFESKC